MVPTTRGRRRLLDLEALRGAVGPRGEPRGQIAAERGVLVDDLLRELHSVLFAHGVAGLRSLSRRRTALHVMCTVSYQDD
jgi:hypothetical protein